MLRYAIIFAAFLTMFARSAAAACNCEFERTLNTGDRICSQDLQIRQQPDSPDLGYGPCEVREQKCVRALMYGRSYQCDCNTKVATIAQTTCQMVGKFCTEVPVGGGAVVKLPCDQMATACLGEFAIRDECGQACNGVCSGLALTSDCPGTNLPHGVSVYIPGVCKSCETKH